MTTVVGTPPGVTASGYRAAPPPTLPVTGSAVWLDASYAPSFTYSTGSSVSQWRDLSGNNRHFTQATASLQPARTGTQNGKATVVFDGTDDYMDTAAFTMPQPFTVFMAMTAAAYAADATQGLFSSVAGSLQTYVSTGGGAIGINLYAGANAYISGGALIDGAPHVQIWVYNGASSSSGVDAAAPVTGNPGTAGTTTGLRLSERNLGAGYRINGPVFELIVYPSVLSAGDRTTIQTYLKTKWGTP